MEQELVEEVLQTNLHVPAVIVVKVVNVAVGRLLLVELEYRRAIVNLVESKRRNGVGSIARILLNAPMRAEHIANVHDIEAELELVAGVANLEAEILCQTEVELVEPRSTIGVSLGILALVAAEVIVLLDECPELLYNKIRCQALPA